MCDEQAAECGPFSKLDTAPPMAAGARDALMDLVARLEDPAFRPGEWRILPGQMPYYALSETARDAVQVLSLAGVVYAFDWVSWQEEGKRYVDQPDLVLDADLETCRRLLTMHFRVDRFVQGHLGTMFESGHILEVLRRLLTIQEETP